MKKLSIILGILIFVLLSPSVFGVVEDVNCFDYYWYGRDKKGNEVNIFQELYPEKAVYSAGDNVRINYEVKNEFGSPLVEGDIFAIVLYRGEKDVDRTEGDDILDDFWVEKDINLDVDKSYEKYFEWSIPKNAKPGVYVVNLYYMVKEKFSISGLSFHTEIPGTTTTFKVENLGEQKTILLDKNETYVNDEKYLFRAYIPSFSLGDEIRIKTQLLSEGLENAKIKYELYSWADTSESDRIDKFTKEETLALDENPKILEYSLKDLPVGVYVAKFTATSGELKSILRVRFVIKGSKGKFIFVGLDHFPLMKNDETNVFFCIENSAAYPGEVNVNFTGRGTVSVIATDGSEIAKETYGPEEVTPQVEGKKFSFKAPSDLTKLTLKADLYDDKTGELMDYAEIVYDYSNFLGIEKFFKLVTMKNGAETTTFAPGDTLSYKVTYEDKYKDALSGEVVIYLEDKDGKVIEMEEKPLKGILKGSISLSELDEGTYTLKVIEKEEKLKDSKEITIAKVSTTVEKTTTIPVTEEKGLSVQTLLWIIVILAIILILVKLFWKKK